jgi:hypothetical protein
MYLVLPLLFIPVATVSLESSVNCERLLTSFTCNALASGILGNAEVLDILVEGIRWRRGVADVLCRARALFVSLYSYISDSDKRQKSK